MKNVDLMKQIAVGVIGSAAVSAFVFTKNVIHPLFTQKISKINIPGIKSAISTWRVVNASSFVVNVVAVAVPGRVDGEMAKEMKELKNDSRDDDNHKKENDMNKDGTKDGFFKQRIKKTSKYRSLFIPAGYAFAIWGFIFSSEFVFSLRSLFNIGRDELYAREATAFYACANVLQSLWCVTFREWTERPRYHWINAFLLGLEAFALWNSKEFVYFANKNNNAFTKESAFVSIPIRTHFAWIICACGININTVCANAFDANTQLITACATAIGATAIGLYSSVFRKDACTPFVFAWALYAVYRDGGYHKKNKKNTSSTNNSNDDDDNDGDDVDAKKNKKATTTTTTTTTKSTSPTSQSKAKAIPSEKQTKQLLDCAYACSLANVALSILAFFL